MCKGLHILEFGIYLIVVHVRATTHVEPEEIGCVLRFLVSWLVVFGLTVLLDSISVYIGPSLREGERKERR